MEKSRILLSIIIPVGHLDRDFQNLIEFFSAQASSEIEYILIHDLKKGVWINIESVAKEFPNLEIVTRRGEYGSPGMTRNAGLEIARGIWVAFCDADDFLRVDNVMSEIKLHEGMSLIIGQFQRKSMRPEVKIARKVNNMKDFYLDPGFWRMVFRNELVRNVKFPQIKMGEDLVFLADILRMQPRIIFTQKLFYEYTVGNPLQSTRKTEFFVDIVDAIRLIKNHNPKWEDCPSDRWLIARLSMTSIKNNYISKGLRGLFLNWEEHSKSKWLILRLTWRKMVSVIGL